ncbi:acylphosphatase [Salipaludibacillus daqingensis]|uniref:acylphosphatase n=1 Tax=Salipaludibacillus daqingensis TaxID=3041001 RepID=UPI0024735D8B|nr:acylphosphatase [Salipaludibacillus daqingensis]
MIEDKPNENFLPHLTEEMVTEAKGPELDAFAIALEGWRRGLTLKWYAKNAPTFQGMNVWNVEKPGKLFSLASDEQFHCFFRSRGDRVSNEAVEVCMDKHRTKDVLQKNGVSVPGGKTFEAEAEIEIVLQYASELGFPIVVKPIDGSFGRGVYSNIKSSEELTNVLEKQKNAEEPGDYLVERFIPGDEYRVYVVDQEVVGVIMRIPANVMGDGEHTIKQLIDIKNAERDMNPRLSSCPIVINEEVVKYLQENSLTLDDVVKENEIVKLTEKSNISIGGDPISMDIDSVEKVCEVSIQAVNAIDDLPHAAVDVIWDKVSGEVAVLEINPSAQLGSLLFPMEGPSFDVPSAIIDYYFPETKDVKVEKEKLYFDLSDVLFPLKSKTSLITTVSPAFLSKVHVVKYTVYGDVGGIDYHRGLRKQAFERDLSGFVMNLSDGSMEVIVAGEDIECVNDFENAIWEDPERSEVERVESSAYDGPVKIGFEIKADLKTQLEELKTLKVEVEQTEKKYKKLKKRNEELRNSISWKISSPIRVVGDTFKMFRVKR